MVAFQKMWEDVGCSFNQNSYTYNIQSTGGINSGFMVNEEGDVIFITREDFVDFWNRLQYFHQVSKEQILNDKNGSMKYIYEIVKTLPYVKEESDVLTLMEE